MRSENQQKNKGEGLRSGTIMSKHEDGGTLTKRATKKETDSWCTNLPTEHQLKILDMLHELHQRLKKSRPEHPYPHAVDLSKRVKKSRDVASGYCRTLRSKGWVRQVEKSVQKTEKSRAEYTHYALTKEGQKVRKGQVRAKMDDPTRIFGLCDGAGCYFVGIITKFRNTYLCNECLLGEDTPVTLEDVMSGKNTSVISEAENHAVLSHEDFAEINKKVKKNGIEDPCSPWPLSGKVRKARKRKARNP